MAVFLQQADSKGALLS